MTSPKNEHAAALSAIAEDYWQVYLFYSPIEALGHGHEDARGCFMRESLDDLRQKGLARRGLLSRLKAVEPAYLAGEDVTTYSMLKRQLELELRLESIDDDLRPNFFPMGPEFAFQYGATSFNASNDEDAEYYLGRLNSIPGAMLDLVARFEAGADKGYRLPEVLLPRVLANLEAYSKGAAKDSVLLTPLAGPGFERQRTRATAIMEKSVQPALVRYRNEVERIYSKARRSSIALNDEPGGHEYYAALIQRHTSLDLSPEEIHEVGKVELQRIEDELSAVAKDAGFAGDIEAMRKHVSSSPEFVLASAEALRERVEILSKRIDFLIPTFFETVPRATYGVRSIPAALAPNSPPAYAQPAPADRSGAGIHWITSLPERCPTYMHVPLALHEAWPGHLMHLSRLEEIEGLPSFRKFGATQHTAYIEGWALYCEALGTEMGLYDDAFAHFGRLSMDAWRAARLVIDTGIHALGWQRDEAVSFLEKRQAMGRAAAEAEIDRYIGMPAQALAYKLGHIAIRELRDEAKVRFGATFSIRSFHERLFNGGALPLAVLRDHVRQWLPN